MDYEEINNNQGVNMKSLRVVFYAINGTGLGHITRLNNIAEDAAILCERLGIKPIFEFLTTSDAPSVVSKFITTKLPSKTTIRQLGLPVRSTTAAVKSQIISFMTGARADCIVLDTNPKGSYGEFPFLRDLARTSVFIDREKKSDVIDSSFKKHVKLFDSVIVPESQCAIVSDLFHPNMVYSGKIHSFKPEKSYSRKDSKEFFGASSKTLIYLSSGGGGDPQSESQLMEWINILTNKLPLAKIIVGYGPLYKGTIDYSRDNVIPYTNTNINQFFPGFDFAVSAAGYNTFEELKAARCPGFFYALEKGMDDQLQRIETLSKQQLCGLVDLTQKEQSLNVFLSQLDVIKEQLSKQPYESGSVYAAAQVLKAALSKRDIFIPDFAIDNQVNELIKQRIKSLNNLKAIDAAQGQLCTLKAKA